MDLLFLAHRIPYPPNKGDKLRSFHLLRHLSARHQVHLGTFVDDPDDWRHADTLRALCGRCCFVELNPKKAKLRSLRALGRGEPLTLPYYRDARLSAWVREVIDGHGIRAAVVFSSAMAQYVMGAPELARIADLVDVDSDKWQQYSATQRWPLSAIYRREGRTLLDYERRVTREFDASVLVSRREAELYRGLAPESATRVHYANNGVDVAFFSPERKYENPYRRDDLPVVFTGAMDYWPNVDAVTWFAQEVLPGLRRRFPKVLFCIVGARPAPEVMALAREPNIRVTGTVDDVRPWIAHARAAVAPLRIARGVQNKVLEAMAMGKAVVASSQAASGLEARDGKELLVAETPQAFGEHLVALLEERSGDFLGVAARQRVLASYSWERNLGVFDSLLEQAMEARQREARGDSSANLGNRHRSGGLVP